MVNPVDLFTRFAEHGGLAAVCLVLTWVVWRQHTEQRQTIATYIQLGERQGVQMERTTQQLERIGHMLQQVEGYMSAVTFCPVSQVSSATLAKAAQEGINLRREDIEAAFSNVVEQIVSQKRERRRNPRQNID